VGVGREIAMAVAADAAPASTDPADAPGSASAPAQKSVQEVLESMLSKKNLVRDQFLASKVNPQMYISIDVLLDHDRLKSVGATAEAIVEAATRSSRLGIDEAQTKVRPLLKSKRNVIILRDVAEDATEEDIRALFVGAPHAEKLASVKPEVNRTWFIKFDLDDGTQDVVLWLRSQKLKGQPVNAAIKSEHFLRGFFPMQMPQGLSYFAAGAPPAVVDFDGACFGGMQLQASAVLGAQPVMQATAQPAGYWQAWGTRVKPPPLVFTSSASSSTPAGAQEAASKSPDALNSVGDGGYDQGDGKSKGKAKGKTKGEPWWAKGKGGDDWGWGKGKSSESWGFGKGKSSGDWGWGKGKPWEEWGWGKGKANVNWAKGKAELDAAMGWSKGKACNGWGGVKGKPGEDWGWPGKAKGKGAEDFYKAKGKGFDYKGKAAPPHWYPEDEPTEPPVHRKGAGSERGAVEKGRSKGAAASPGEKHVEKTEKPEGGKVKWVPRAVPGTAGEPADGPDKGEVPAAYHHDFRRYGRGDFEDACKALAASGEQLPRPEALERLGGDFPVFREAPSLELAEAS